jgi:glutathione synthase/RimK-type ligase-like ATP-grasp enzyme
LFVPVPRVYRESWQTLSLSSGTQQVSEHAREAAEAELDLARIRKVRAYLFETLYFADTAAPDGIADLNSKLAKLERYERRAFSRRRRALRAM